MCVSVSTIEYCFTAGIQCGHVESAVGDSTAGIRCRYQLRRYRVSLSFNSYHCYYRSVVTARF